MRLLHWFRTPLAFLVGGLLSAGTVASAQVTTVPSGLNPGDSYRLAFVSSTTRDGTSADIADYNSFVTGVANTVPELAALNTQWFAVGSTAAVSAQTNIGITGTGTSPVFRLDDQMVVADGFGLWMTASMSLLTPIGVNETGAVQTTLNQVFTGTTPGGVPDSSSLGSATVTYGRSTNTNSTWTRASNQPATVSRSFYAISAPLTVPGTVSYCTAGTSSGGCQATLSAVGTPSASASSGFTITASIVEGGKDGLLFFGANGRQANTWGNGTSFQCVMPPVKRAGLLVGTGTNGACDGSFSQDLNARWTAKPAQNPGSGAVVQTQLWYRDPFNTSNQTTSLSDALEFTVSP